MWSIGVLDYNSGVCCFKEVKTTTKQEMLQYVTNAPEGPL